MAVHECLGIVNDISRSARASGRDGYRKLNPVIVTGVTQEASKLPLCSCDAPSGRFARRSSWAAKLREVPICGTIWG